LEDDFCQVCFTPFTYDDGSYYDTIEIKRSVLSGMPEGFYGDALSLCPTCQEQFRQLFHDFVLKGKTFEQWHTMLRQTWQAYEEKARKAKAENKEPNCISCGLPKSQCCDEEEYACDNCPSWRGMKEG
jgi:hypothetical protein